MTHPSMDTAFPEIRAGLSDDDYNILSECYYAQQERRLASGSLGKVIPEWAIDRDTGRFLFELAKMIKPRLTVEIGLCQGASALHFTAAHASMGSGLHLAVDPFQDQYFVDQGKLAIEDMGLAPWFMLLRARSDRALPMLQAAGANAEIVFIDGDHRFDAVFIDYYYADKLVPVNGYLIFDEGGYECPTNRVKAFILNNMANYEQIESPGRLYVFKKTREDERSFADEWPF